MDELTNMEKKNQLVCIMCNDVMMLLHFYTYRNAMQLHKQWTDVKHKGYMGMYKYE